MTISISSLTLPLAIAALSLGCGADEPQVAGVVVRDSAGIQIVENHSSSWALGEEWRISSEPKLRIGTVDGASGSQFHRVTDAVRLSDGRLVIANAGSYQLRYFSPDGAHLLTIGGEGEGPGEFKDVSRLFTAEADTVVAVDRELRRVTYFDGQGAFAGSFSMVPPLGRLADGSFVFTEWSQRAPRSQIGFVREPRNYVRYSPEADTSDTIAQVPGNDSFRRTQTAGGQTHLAYSRPLFARQLQTAISGELIYSGGGDTFEATVYSPDGDVRRIIRKAASPRAVSASDMEHYRASRLEYAETDEARRRIERQIADVPHRETMPAYSDLLLDDDGFLWIQEFRPYWEEAPTSWSVFTPRGRLLGEVKTPRGFRVTEIGNDYVLGIMTGELDVEYVLLYGLEKAQRP